VKVGDSVVEFQHSSISVEMIEDRENFYGAKMTWVLDGEPFRDRFLFRRPESKTLFGKSVRYFSNTEGWWKFTWKHARASWQVAKRPVVIDFGHSQHWQANETYPTLFLIKKMHAGPPCAGWGIFITRREFVEHYWLPDFGMVAT
jgi:competence CoiA-like predicted nuclease